MKNRDLPTPSPQMGSEQKLTGGRELTEKCITFGEIGGCFNGGTRRGFYKKKEHSECSTKSLESGSIVSEMKNSLEDNEVYRGYLFMYSTNIY